MLCQGPLQAQGLALTLKQPITKVLQIDPQCGCHPTAVVLQACHVPACATCWCHIGTLVMQTASLSLKQNVADSMHDDSKIFFDYKGRPRMVSNQQGMVAADQGDCSAMGAPHMLCMHVRVAAYAALHTPPCLFISCLPCQHVIRHHEQGPLASWPCVNHYPI